MQVILSAVSPSEGQGSRHWKQQLRIYQTGLGGGKDQVFAFPTSISADAKAWDQSLAATGKVTWVLLLPVREKQNKDPTSNANQTTSEFRSTS